MYYYKNKRVLIISYFYPPLGGSGVQRAQKFVKYLPNFAWKPYVLTVKPIEYIAYDENLLEEVKFIPAYRTESIDPMRFLYLFEKIRKKRERIYHTTDMKIKKLSREIFPIDSKIGWLPFAIPAGIRICKKKNIKRIYATLSPYSSAIAAYYISKFTKIPYVLDYRDLWQGKPDISYLTKWHKDFSFYWERKVLKNASKVIINTKLAMKKIMSIFPEIDKQKFTVIYNGFDSEDFNLQVNKRNDNKIIFTYTGGFYGERTPEFFITALKNIKKELPENVEFRFVGNYHKKVLEELNSIPEFIRVIPQVTHKKSIEYLFESDYLLLFIAKNKSDIVIPAKLFEYMATKKPILAMAPPNGEAAMLIKKYNLGKLSEPDDIKSIEKNILEMVKSRVKVPHSNDLSIFTRKYQTGLLADILEKL